MGQNGSVDITVTDLPEAVYRTIKREARRNRRSLNAEIIHTLEEAAAEAERMREVGKVRRELERLSASLLPFDDSVPLIRRGRER